MENLHDRNSTSRQEARDRIRQELQRRREEARRLDRAEAKERERERLFVSPTPPPMNSIEESSVPALASAPAPAPASDPVPVPSVPEAKPSKNAGWDQGDGRRADQVSVYESGLPDTVRARLEPVKGTHFRFRQPSDEQALLEALSSPGQTATYQATGKKDVTITSADGQLLGNIHFLHMDSRDIHRPEKYYMKFYLFNFMDAATLRDTKQRLLRFAHSFSHPSRPSRPSRPSSPHLPLSSFPRPSRPRPSRFRSSRAIRTSRPIRPWKPTRKNKLRRNRK